MAEQLRIESNGPLTGEVTVSGSKNAALPVLFTSLLTPEECTFKNIPQLNDITTTAALLKLFGVAVEQDGSTVRTRAPQLSSHEAPYKLVKTMRASILALGPLVARFGEARISLPGGCAIGARPVDMHLSALKKLGAEIDISEGFIVARARKLRGAHIHFRRKTVTGTENFMMAAVLADGTTVLDNAAQEPEIVDLAICLRSMGARVFGEGTKEIVIEGVASLKGARHEVCGDRIEAGTFMCAAMATHGSIHVRGINPETMTNLLAKVTLTGCRIESDRGVLHVKTPKVLQPVDIATAPYPGFPTDMQAQWMAAMLFADGDTRITEKVFENRFLHVAELRRMGAEIIEEDSHTCTIKGLARPLSGAPVMATDLRASASLVIAALAARGVTTVDRIYHLDRGYERFEKKLSELGAKIARVRV